MKKIISAVVIIAGLLMVGCTTVEPSFSSPCEGCFTEIISVKPSNDIVAQVHQQPAYPQRVCIKAESGKELKFSLFDYPNLRYVQPKDTIYYCIYNNATMLIQVGFAN